MRRAGSSPALRNHQEVMLPMAQRLYRVISAQGSGPEAASDPMNEDEAWGVLGVSFTLHLITGWDVRKCSCGAGFIAERGDVLRYEHLEPVRDAQALAVAV